jgi:chemotaxis methyl-accepting protein methylase
VKNPLAEIAELILRETGVALPAARQSPLRAAVGRVAPGLDPGAFLRAASDPVGGRALLDKLIDEVTNQETTFLRDRRQLDAIAWPSLLRGVQAAGSRTIRVWSAACASGEEVYTLALLAAEALALAQTPVDVLGTDISGAALAAAAAGRYRERAVGGLSPALRQRYLDQQADGSYLVGAHLRGLVRFRRHNFVSDPIPPRGEDGFDVVVCRNVLIYFEAPLVERVIGLLRRPAGSLVARAGRPESKASSPQRTLRSPLVPPLQPALSREQRLTAALDAADKGARDDALAGVASLLADDPLDTDAHFVRGLVTLAAGEPAQAVAALRRALYTDATFALAAFVLGRSYDALGDLPAARRAYEQALRTLDPEDHRHELLLQQVDIGDIAAACRARLAGRP